MCSAVLAAIMIPVGILVIAPAMGQHALNVAVMNIPNSTVYGLADDLTQNNVAKIYNSVKLDQSSLPFGSRLHETNLVLNVPAGDFGGSLKWNTTNLMWFPMVQEDLSHGMNDFQFTSPLTIFQPTDNFVHWSFPGLFLPDYSTIIRLVGQPKMSAMGIFHMDLKMGKNLNCTFLPVPTEFHEDLALLQETSEETIIARRLEMMKVRGFPPITLTCQDLGELDDDLIDEILQNFTNDMAVTTTLRPITTPAPTPAPATSTAAPASASTTAAPASTTAAPASTTVAPASTTVV